MTNHMKSFNIGVNFYVVFVVLMLFSAYPYIFFLLFGLPEEKIMNFVFFGLSVFVYLFVRSKSGRNLPSIIVLSISLQVFGWLIFTAYHSDTSYLTRIFFLLFTFLCIDILNKTSSVYKFSQFYNHIFLIISILGLIAFVLIFIGVWDYFLIVERRGNPIFYYGITCSNAVYGNLVRIAGFFDEPGALASWGMFVLIANKIIFDNKKLEILLIVSLFATLSAAYFVLLPIYLLLFYSHNSKKAIFFAIFSLLVIFEGFRMLSSNEDFMMLTIERFEGGEIRSRRYDYSDEAKKAFQNSVLMGVGSRTLDERYEHVNDNPYEILAKDGAVGYFITYLPLLLLCLKYRKKEVFSGTLILFISYQQRPFHINEMHYFMLYLLCLLVALKYEKNNMYTANRIL